MYLTFDDGPVPEATPWVLDRLASHGAQATFFCVGSNADAYPELVERIRAEGHGIGGHTWDHRNGRKEQDRAYFRSVISCQNALATHLFRPPYGRLNRHQMHLLSRRYCIVMWDVLSGDFDARCSPDRCARNVLFHARNGSIVVFHDSVKAWPRLREALPRVLTDLQEQGYSFEALPGSTTDLPDSFQASMPPTRS